MEFSLSAAARATGKGKSTIHHAVKTGKLSARRCDDGSYRIDASELARVFTLNPSMNVKLDDQEPQPGPMNPMGTELAELRVRVEMLGDQLTRERETYRETVDDLRKRLDRAEERVHALTYQHSQVTETTRPKGFLQRLLGL